MLRKIIKKKDGNEGCVTICWPKFIIASEFLKVVAKSISNIGK